MYTCDRCGKGSLSLMNVSHSHRRTQKTSMPNLHRISVTLKGERVALRLCSKCSRIMRADDRAAVAAKALKIEALSSGKTSAPGKTVLETSPVTA